MAHEFEMPWLAPVPACMPSVVVGSDVFLACLAALDWPRNKAIKQAGPLAWRAALQLAARYTALGTRPLAIATRSHSQLAS